MLTLGVGQCGLQVTDALMAKVQQALGTETSVDAFHDSQGNLNCILVDSEPKVAKRVRAKQELIRADNVHVEHGGRGNNWALGYNGRLAHKASSSKAMAFTSSLHGGYMETAETSAEHLQGVYDSVRKQVERMDVHEASLIIHSLAGGTGSGLGSRIMEHMRQEYGASVVSACVAPFALGDTALQHYNALLTLQWMHDNCDAVLLFENEQIMAQLRDSPSSSSSSSTSSSSSLSSQGESVSLSAINGWIASALAGALLPMGPSYRKLPVFDIVQQVCPLSHLKLCSLSHSGSAHNNSIRRPSWSVDITRVMDGLPRFVPGSQQAVHVHSAMLCMRGIAGASDVTSSADFKHDVDGPLSRSLRKRGMGEFAQLLSSDYDPWDSCTPLLAASKVPRGVPRLTMLANHTGTAAMLQRIYDRASLQFNAGAFVHWYSRYGVHAQTFASAFDTLADVLDAQHEAGK